MLESAAGGFLGAGLAAVLADLAKKNIKPAVVVVSPQNSPGNSDITKFIPVARCSEFVTCQAATNFFPQDVEPLNKVGSCLFRIQVALTVAGIFSVLYKIGSQTFTHTLNSGVALTANSLYIFDVLIDPNDKVNFQSSVAGGAHIRIQEITLAVQ